MGTINKCKGCGGQNDLVANVCAYCDSPLIAYSEDKITDEELIESTGKWVALFIENLNQNSAFGPNGFIGSMFDVKKMQKQRAQIQKKGVFGIMKEAYVGSDEEPDVWDGKTAHYSTEEIKINTSKCMSILVSRMASNPTLAPIHTHFKAEIEKAENSLKGKMKIAIACGVALFIFLCIGYIGIFATQMGK